MTEVKETIVRSKRKNQLKELERCKSVYGEENAVTIDRTTKWGSPFAIGKDGSREEVLQKHQDYLRKRPDLLRAIRGIVRQSPRMLVLARAVSWGHTGISG